MPTNPSHPAAIDAFSPWEDAVRFELFSEREQPTLSVPEQIAAELARRIISGTLAPGARLGEQQVADEFHVSRGPVREAIRILEREGLATVLPRRGTVVTELSAQEVAEIFEIREALFATVMERIIERCDPAFLAALRAGVARLGELAPRPDAAGVYAETVYRLLIVTSRQSDNLRLRRMLRALSLQTLRYSKLGLASPERRARSAQLWQQSLAAVENGDLAAGLQLLRQRIRESAAEAARQLQVRP